MKPILGSLVFLAAIAFTAAVAADPSPSRDVFGLTLGKPLTLPNCPQDIMKKHPMCVRERSRDQELGAVVADVTFEGNDFTGTNQPPWVLAAAGHTLTVWLLNNRIEAAQFFIDKSQSNAGYLALIRKYSMPNTKNELPLWVFDDLRVETFKTNAVRISTPIFDNAFQKFLQKRALKEQNL